MLLPTASLRLKQFPLIKHSSQGSTFVNILVYVKNRTINCQWYHLRGVSSQFNKSRLQWLAAGKTEPEKKFRFPAETHCAVGQIIYIGVGSPIEMQGISALLHHNTQQHSAGSGSDEGLLFNEPLKSGTI